MSTVKTKLSINDIDIITTMSDSQKAKVQLAAVKESASFVVFKELEGKSIASLYQRINDLQSPYFPRFYGIWEENGKTMLIEEYVSGETLAEKLEKEHSFSESELNNYITQLCRALCELHHAEPPIIHRDLKPENVIITKDGRLKLVDFDAAREYDEALSRDTVIMGTKEYASPEQFGFTQTDVRSDIYSFGIVFSELLRHTNASEAYLKKCQKIIDKATMFDPDKRYPDTDALLKELQTLNDLANKKKYIFIPIIALCMVILLVASFSIRKYFGENKSKTIGLNSNITTTTSGATTETSTTEVPTTEAPTTEEPTTEVPTVETPPEAVSYPEGMRFQLSYGDGVVEYYEFFNGVNSRITELNNSDYEYVIAYIDNTGFATSDEDGTYIIEALPPVAGKIIFTVGDNVEKIGAYTLRIYDVNVPYPVVTYNNLMLTNCTFEDITVDGSKGAKIEFMDSGKGVNRIGDITLTNGAMISVFAGQEISIRSCTIEDVVSILYLDDGVYHIKELHGYYGIITVNLSESFDIKERTIFTTESDVSLDQFQIHYKNKDQFETVLEKNSEGQNVISLVQRK